MSDPQQGVPGDQVPPIPLAPGAEVPPVPQAPSAPPVPDAAPAPVPPVVPEVDTQAPVNPYVQPPANPYAQNTVNPYVQPMQNPYAPAADAAPQAFAVQPDAAQAQAQAPGPAHVQPGASHAQPDMQPQPDVQPQPYTQPQPFAQQQQTSGPYAPQPQYPAGIYGAPGYASPPMGPSRFNVLGLISLIAGGVAGLFGLVLSWIPLIGFVFVVIALAGVGLGIFGLLAKNKSKGLAIAGTIVSGLALLVTAAISIIMLIVFTAATSYEPYDPYGSDYSSGPVQIDPDAEIAQPGDTITFSDYDDVEEWQIVVGTPNLDATADVLAADEYNLEPSAGNQFVVVPVTFTYLGSESDSVHAVYTDLVTADGEAYLVHYAEYPNSLYDAPELRTGETTEVNLVFEVPSADVPGALLALGTIWSDDVYVAIG